MNDYIEKARSGLRNRTTYRVGLLHTKANRLLKQRTAQALEVFDITPPAWAFLGVLNDARAGIRLTKAAEELGVEAPFITNMLHELEKKELVQVELDASDNRAKNVSLTRKGATFVENVEGELRTSMRPSIEGISLKDLAVHFSVLEKIIKNTERNGA